MLTSSPDVVASLRWMRLENGEAMIFYSFKNIILIIFKDI
jgi:hypothetical protein